MPRHEVGPSGLMQDDLVQGVRKEGFSARGGEMGNLRREELTTARDATKGGRNRQGQRQIFSRFAAITLLRGVCSATARRKRNPPPDLRRGGGDEWAAVGGDCGGFGGNAATRHRWQDGQILGIMQRFAPCHLYKGRRPGGRPAVPRGCAPDRPLRLINTTANPADCDGAPPGIRDRPSSAERAGVAAAINRSDKTRPCEFLWHSHRMIFLRS